MKSKLRFINCKLPDYTIALIVLITAIIIFKSSFISNPIGWKNVIDGDGKGYYHYLPSLFLDNQKISTESFSNIIDGKTVNQFYCGEAILLLPFFALACLISFIFSSPIDGYSSLFQICISLAALTYFTIGLIYFRKLLSLFKFDHLSTSLTILFVSLGTNLFYYSAFEPSMSHVYSFASITVFLFFSKKLFINYSSRYLLICSIALGIITLIRPFNIIVILFLPFLSENFKEFLISFKEVFSKKFTLLLSLLIFSFLIFIQCLLWYRQTGNIFIDSYHGQKFNFLSPYLTEFLFSFRKGFFIYTPVALVFIAGLIPLYKENKWRFLIAFLFLILLCYTMSSWWCWYYGDSLGMRPMVDFYTIFGILFAYLLKGIRSNYFKGGVIVMCGVLLSLNLLQTYQYATGIIHPDAMNNEKYMFAFLKTGERYRNTISGTYDIPLRELQYKPILTLTNNFESTLEFSTGKHIQKINNAYSGDYVNKLDSLTEYSDGFTINIMDNLKPFEEYYVQCTLWKYETDTNSASNAHLVFSLDSSNGKNYYWKGMRINELPREPKKWFKTQFNFKMPLILNNNDLIKIYVWNPAKKRFYIDDLKISLYKYKE